MASIASASIFIDSHHPNKQGLCAVSIRITYDRKRKYYLTKYNFSIEDFSKVLGAKPRGEFKTAKEDIEEQLAKAKKVIKELNIFSFEQFERKYLEDGSSKISVCKAFQKYIEVLTKEERIGTSITYDCANNSLRQFYGSKYDKLKFIDITPEFLKRYEKSMLDLGRSVSTVGIYLRSLRTLFNMAISEGNLNKEFYPFGRRKYEIPTSVNIKKALTLRDIKQIFDFQTQEGSYPDMSKDYWIFMYLCNGINMKDMCKLKWQDLKGDTIEFIRAKTARTKRKIEPIRIMLLPKAIEIIEKHGTNPRNPDNYIFPLLNHGLNALEETKRIKQLTHVVNDNMERIRKELGIEKQVTTYTARHSFATILKRGGASTALISESLGHNNERTTQSYLDSFEDESKREISKLLTNF